MVPFTCKGMNEDSVSDAISSYDFGALSEIIGGIAFRKGLFSFAFKTPPGSRSWKHWLHTHKMYGDMERLFIALHKADGFDPYQWFEDQGGNRVAYVTNENNGKYKVIWQ